MTNKIAKIFQTSVSRRGDSSFGQSGVCGNRQRGLPDAEPRRASGPDDEKLAEQAPVAVAGTWSKQQTTTSNAGSTDSSGAEVQRFP